MFSAALCRGLIEARPIDGGISRSPRCFPRLYAAASLKHQGRVAQGRVAQVVFRGFMPRPH